MVKNVWRIDEDVRRIDEDVHVSKQCRLMMNKQIVSNSYEPFEIHEKQKWYVLRKIV